MPIFNCNLIPVICLCIILFYTKFIFITSTNSIFSLNQSLFSCFLEPFKTFLFIIKSHLTDVISSQCELCFCIAFFCCHFNIFFCLNIIFFKIFTRNIFSRYNALCLRNSLVSGNVPIINSFMYVLWEPFTLQIHKCQTVSGTSIFIIVSSIFIPFCCFTVTLIYPLSVIVAVS